MGSLLVARGGKILLRRAYGMAVVEWDVPNTTETKFRIGSITKTFSAAAGMQLQKQGKLSVNDPVSKYVFDSPSAWYAITNDNLLTHTSRIPNFTESPEDWKLSRLPVTPSELLARFKTLSLDLPSGAKFN